MPIRECYRKYNSRSRRRSSEWLHPHKVGASFHDDSTIRASLFSICYLDVSKFQQNCVSVLQMKITGTGVYNMHQKLKTE